MAANSDDEGTAGRRSRRRVQVAGADDEDTPICPVPMDFQKDRPQQDEQTKKRLADTNMENYCSQEHRDLKRSISMKERAWHRCGSLEDVRRGSFLGDDQKVEVWRIEKFKVKAWPVERYGEFYRGDSYIILNTYKDQSQDVKYNVHFWLGKETTQDEAGTAAYKTVELDDFLGDLPVQFRECDGHENKEFKDLFPQMTVLDGGIDSGFNHVEPEVYEPRLLHITDDHGKLKKMGSVKVIQESLQVESLNDHDCFILDLGETLLQFHPPLCSFREKYKSGQVMAKIAAERFGRVKKTYTVDWHDNPAISAAAAQFWNAFGGKPPREVLAQHTEEEIQEELSAGPRILYHVSDETGEMKVEEVARGDVLDRGMLLSDDCFILDLGNEVFVWCGGGANKNELKESMVMAVQFLTQSGRPMYTPVIRVIEGHEPERFWMAFEQFDQSYGFE